MTAPDVARLLGNVRAFLDEVAGIDGVTVIGSEVFVGPPQMAHVTNGTTTVCTDCRETCSTASPCRCCHRSP